MSSAEPNAPLRAQMDCPIGMMIGNGLEVVESVHCLQGKVGLACLNADAPHASESWHHAETHLLPAFCLPGPGRP